MLRVYAVAWLGSFVLSSLLEGGDAPLRIYGGAFILLLAVVLFVLRGSPIAWSLSVLMNGVAAISPVLFEAGWAWGVFNLALLALLFTPQARQYIWRRRRPAS